MAEPYNLTLVNEGNGLLNIIQQSNGYVDSTFGLMILILIAAIIFFRLKMYETKTAIFASMFVTTIIAVLFFLISLISFNILLTFIVLTAVTAALSWVN